jgi:hypothetical protein
MQPLSAAISGHARSPKGDDALPPLLDGLVRAERSLAATHELFDGCTYGCRKVDLGLMRRLRISWLSPPMRSRRCTRASLAGWRFSWGPRRAADRADQLESHTYRTPARRAQSTRGCLRLDLTLGAH